MGNALVIVEAPGVSSEKTIRPGDAKNLFSGRSGGAPTPYPLQPLQKLFFTQLATS